MLKRISTHGFLVVCALVSTLPILLVVINSFKVHSDIVRNPLAIQFSAHWNNYIQAWNAGNFGRGFMNSFIYVGSTVVIVLFVSTLAAYVIAGRKVKGTGLIMLYFLVAMTVPVQLFMIPLYSVFNKLGLLGSLVATSFLLAACYVPLAIMILRTFLIGVPKELEESARIDGAGTIQVFVKMILPVLSPGIITVGVITSLNAWNEFLLTSTFLQGERKFTATLTLMTFNGVNFSNLGFNMAASTILIAPVFVFFLLSQKYFIDGIVSGAVKG